MIWKQNAHLWSALAWFSHLGILTLYSGISWLTAYSETIPKKTKTCITFTTLIDKFHLIQRHVGFFKKPYAEMQSLWFQCFIDGTDIQLWRAIICPFWAELRNQRRGSYGQKSTGSPVNDVEHTVLTVIGAVYAQFVQQVQQMCGEIAIKLVDRCFKARCQVEVVSMFC